MRETVRRRDVATGKKMEEAIRRDTVVGVETEGHGRQRVRVSSGDGEET